jgi:hypothetical protein
MKKVIGLILTLFFTVNYSSISHAQDFSLGGYTKIFAHPNLNSPYRFDRLGSRLQLKVQGSVFESVDFFSAVDFNWDLADTTYAQKMRTYPVESYIDIFSDWLDVRIGNQFIFWGTTDWVNPTDNINPWDYVNISAEIEDYRIPVTAAKFDFYPSDAFTFEFVWLPVFQPNKIPLQFPLRMGKCIVGENNPQLPEKKLSNSEFALRFSSRLNWIDFSFSYFRGYDKNFSLFSSFNPGDTPKIIFTPKYNKVNIFGGDFVSTFDKFALKGEAAYFKTEDTNGRNIFIENNHLKYVIGADYNFSEDVSLDLQFIQYVRFNYDKSLEENTRAIFGMPKSEATDKTEESVSAMLKYNAGNYFNLQLISVMNLKDKDFFLLPIVNYNLADAVNLYCGATIFSGKEDSPFGRNKKYSRFFVELKYSF